MKSFCSKAGPARSRLSSWSIERNREIKRKGFAGSRTGFFCMAILIACLLSTVAAVFPQELSQKNWPKNIRQNFEERSKEEEINFRQDFDREMNLILLHPEKARELNEKRLKKLKGDDEDQAAIGKAAVTDKAAASETTAVTVESSVSEKKPADTKNPHKKKNLKDPEARLGGVLKASDVFSYYPMWQQMTNTEVLASGGILTFLLENDRLIFTELRKATKGSAFWDDNRQLINDLGDGATAVGLYTIIALLGGEKNRKVAQVGLESFAYTGFQVIGLKQAVGKSRPSAEYEQRWTCTGNDAFPSGHTATAFSMATVLDRMYNIGWLTYPIAGLNGLARIEGAFHWTSDVFAGALMGYLGANEIMARHGIIDRKKMKRRELWENTLYDVNSYMENSWDSCANFDTQSPQQDNVGILAMNYTISHCITPQLAVLLSSRFHKKTFNTITWNNVEDKQVNIRLAHKVASHGVLYAEQGFQDINYIDIEPNYFNRGLGHFLPDPENWLQHNRLGDSEAGFSWEFSPSLQGRVNYRTFSDYYDEYEFMNGYANVWGAGFTGYFGNRRDLCLNVEYDAGDHSASLPQYAYGLEGLTVTLKKDFSSTCNLNLVHRREERDYRGSVYNIQNKEQDNWSMTGVELSNKFKNDWTASLKYYQKSLSSTNPGWSYRKSVFSLNITSRF